MATSHAKALMSGGSLNSSCLTGLKNAPPETIHFLFPVMFPGRRELAEAENKELLFKT